uniref:N-acetyltransferase domain-containing protein n=1 Tax=Hyaloperonospora arabidopsidis (strain Emoy2) TaxID=559515 RepID=M4BJJ1_HYAAE
MVRVDDTVLKCRKSCSSSSASTSTRKRNCNISACHADEAVKKPRNSPMSLWLTSNGPSRKVSHHLTTSTTSTPEPRAAPSSRNRASNLSPGKVQPLVMQSYIDVGQRSFGKHVVCPTCELLYIVGEEEDEKEHQKFCKRSKRGVTFSKWKTERVLKSFPDTNAKIVEIRRDDASAHVKKLLEIKAVLDDALGVTDKEVFLQRSHFIYIQDHQVVGCVNTECITKAFTLESRMSTLANANNEESCVAESGAVTASTYSHTALVGVCQLWVHPLFRRKCIATRMVDVVREKSIYGMHVAKNLIAFAQPTRNGLQFAKKYVEPCEMLMY